MKRIVILVAAMVFAALSPLHAAGNIQAGKQKSATCAACHGPDGNSVTNLWPKLAGQNAKYLLKQMQEFKKGKNGGRYDPSMTALMVPLSTQDMQDLAAFYEAQKITPGAAKAELLKLGQQIYQGGDLEKGIPACSACHGPRGLGNSEAGFPALSGQHPEYTEKQLVAYCNEERDNDPNKIMRMVVKRMEDKDIKAVASYIAGLY